MKMNKMHMYVYTHTHKLLEITWQVLQEMPPLWILIQNIENRTRDVFILTLLHFQKRKFFSSNMKDHFLTVNHKST